MANQLIPVPLMAPELNMTEDALRKAIHRGLSGTAIPPVTRLGRRVVFVRSAVEAWYQELAEQALKDAGIEPLAVNNKKQGKPQKKAPTADQRITEQRRGWQR
ncbi:MAG: hypothetical protein RQ867_09215 [Mariprofundaceae bacterium]|nr:hypothetical protein [Mariprofundaceae bacterium]